MIIIIIGPALLVNIGSLLYALIHRTGGATRPGAV
jgi:hypothetical protein